MNRFRSKRGRLGELLIKKGIINLESLRKALKIGALEGKHLGSVLIEEGIAKPKDVILSLKEQMNMPAVNLKNVEIPMEVLKIVPFELVKKYKILPLKKQDDKLILGMENPTLKEVIEDIEFITGRSVIPVILLQSQINAALEFFNKHGYATEKFSGKDIPEKIIKKEKRRTKGIAELFQELVSKKGQDLFITAGAPPSIRVDGHLKRLDMDILTPSDTEKLAYSLFSSRHEEIFRKFNEVDFAYTLENIGRFRINVFRQRNSVALAARVIYDIIPSWEELALPEFLKEYAYSQQGLILIGGPAGHGKTTTLAAIVDYINSTRSANIITIEDPIEYLHSHKKSNVNQREVGVDTESFAIGLKHILRQSPDVIVIGEMRDPESMAIALTAAETGHLVLSTIHSFNAISTVDRIIDMFPSRQHEQIRAQLSEALLLILVQRLVPMASGKGRILAYEKMGQCIGLKKAIREAKTHTLRGQNLGAVDEMISIDVCLSKMVQEGKIKYEDGLKFVDDINTYELLCKKRRKEGL